MGTHRGHLACTWEPRREVTSVPSHKGEEDVSQTEAERVDQALVGAWSGKRGPAAGSGVRLAA